MHNRQRIHPTNSKWGFRARPKSVLAKVGFGGHTTKTPTLAKVDLAKDSHDPLSLISSSLPALLVKTWGPWIPRSLHSTEGERGPPVRARDSTKEFLILNPSNPQTLHPTSLPASAASQHPLSRPPLPTPLLPPSPQPPSKKKKEWKKRKRERKDKASKRTHLCRKRGLSAPKSFGLGRFSPTKCMVFLFDEFRLPKKKKEKKTGHPLEVETFGRSCRVVAACVVLCRVAVREKQTERKPENPHT